jgi:sigma-B regulation protein RsbU (phosphoserine phosphatase)
MTSLQDYLSVKFKNQDIKAIHERLFELSSLFEISQILNSSLQLNSVLNNILLIPMGRLMISKGIILLREGKHFKPKLWKGIPSEVKNTQLDNFLIPDTIHKQPDKKSKKYKSFNEFLSQYQLALAVPIKSKDDLIGCVLYGNKLSKLPFSEDELDFLASLANLSSTAVENALKVDEIQNINQQLDERIQQLKTLFDIAQGLSATLDGDKIIKLMTYAFMGQMLVNRYAIVIKTLQGIQKLDCKGIPQEPLEIIISDQSNLYNLKSAIHLSKNSNYREYERLWKMGVRVIIPMRHQNKSLGYILLGEKINKQTYTDTDLEFLTTLVSQAVISMENARLFQETLEKQRIEQELRVAESIQKKLLPTDIISYQGYDIWGQNISSKEVGGDYFDIIPVSQNRFAFTIADVSGKGVPAALIMANLQAGLRTIITENITLDKVVGKLNNLIYQNTEPDKYVTLFLGILDNQSHQFFYVNAGHNPPLLLTKDNNLRLLEDGGIILGMIPDYNYVVGNFYFDKNDILLCYTDGVNEALNIEEEEFGEKKIKDILIKNRNLFTRDISNKLIQSIGEFTKGIPQYDDITVLMVKRI